ncbi:MAG TPA: TVP38/TMEM64 family protein [Chloroflexi bacterium]|nr:TVP38/TMEM64 family protein [Chloroflexota bacterium]
MQEQNAQTTFSKWLPWLVILVLVGTAAALWQPIAALMTAQDVDQLRAEVAEMGALAPAGLLALSVVQIVGAPIPGYPVQLLSGALFGAFLGGIYAIAGMVAGGLIAAWLARKLGRPFIENHVDPQTLDRYEGLARVDSLWAWVIILIIPLGDFPYYIAGLSRVRLRTLFLAILISRGPFTFLITWAGENSVAAPGWIIALMFVVVLGIVALGYLSRNRIHLFMEKYVLHRLE